ncbi:glutathione S-transferase family protein [Sessilibacter corallicola]|uniref:Glutathione S-transferase family protein n=1 Tax=Sessilibacter corallicola TaxID=2904075 RepID=A0ABQ0A9S3_9GAMM
MKEYQLELVSHHLCPYVQRSVITLLEKNIEHQRVYIDLSDKPQWFLSMSPTGKVPVLKVDSIHVLFESAVICEFLDELTPGSLHSEDLIIKAKHRAWIEFGSQILNKIGAIYNAHDENTLRSECQNIREKFAWIEKEITLPFFAGENFNMVDAVFGPIYRYFDTMENYLPLPIFGGLEKVQQWRLNLSQRPSVISAVSKDYPQLLEEFIIHRQSCLSRRMIESIERIL